MLGETTYPLTALDREGEMSEHLTHSLVQTEGRDDVITKGSVVELRRDEEVSDELLLAQICDGAEEALSILFRRYATAVRNVACRILRDEAEAEEVVQEVFLYIFRKAGMHDEARGRAGTWILHLAYHRAFDRRRYLNTRRFYAMQELEDIGLHLADPRREVPFHEQTLEGILGKPLMAKFHAHLAREQRETIQLFFFEGYTLREIAELTGRPLVNVRNHYYRGLERLRKYVLPKKFWSKWTK